jgi:hypothetical protein
MVMNKPVKSALLTLLMVDSAADVGAALQSLIDNDTEISFAHGGLRQGAAAEIIYRGVSFVVSVDLHGQHISSFKPIFCNLEPTLIRCGIDISLGKHVAGGERVPAIMQALLGIGYKLGTSLNSAAAVWHPAKVVSGFAYFSEAVADYLAGGAFPVLAMVNFKADNDGVINSTGLALLSGQELQVSNSGMDQREIMRRVVRVVHDVAVNGPIRESVKLDGIELDEILELEPLAESGLLRMKACSISDA